MAACTAMAARRLGPMMALAKLQRRRAGRRMELHLEPPSPLCLAREGDEVMTLHRNLRHRLPALPALPALPGVALAAAIHFVVVRATRARRSGLLIHMGEVEILLVHRREDDVTELEAVDLRER